jgi:hypothetical protein
MAASSCWRGRAMAANGIWPSLRSPIRNTLAILRASTSPQKRAIS